MRPDAAQLPQRFRIDLSRNTGSVTREAATAPSRGSWAVPRPLFRIVLYLPLQSGRCLLTPLDWGIESPVSYRAFPRVSGIRISSRVPLHVGEPSRDRRFSPYLVVHDRVFPRV